MPRQPIHLRFRQKTADMGHRAKRIAVALPRSPGAELCGKVGRGLGGERRVAAPGPFPARAVTGGARLDAAFRIALQVQHGHGAISGGGGGRRRHRQASVVIGQALPRRPVHPLGDPAHLRVTSLATGEKLHLPREVARIEPGEARDEIAVALSAQAVARDAGPFRPGVAPAQRDHLAGRLEAVAGRLGSAGKERESERKERGFA